MLCQQACAHGRVFLMFLHIRHIPGTPFPIGIGEEELFSLYHRKMQHAQVKIQNSVHRDVHSQFGCLQLLDWPRVSRFCHDRLLQENVYADFLGLDLEVQFRVGFIVNRGIEGLSFLHIEMCVWVWVLADLDLSEIMLSFFAQKRE